MADSAETRLMPNDNTLFAQLLVQRNPATLDNVLHAIRVLTDPAGLTFPFTQITVSTVGRIDGLQKLAALCRAEPLWIFEEE